MYRRHFAALALSATVLGCGPSEESKNNVVVINATPNNANNTTVNATPNNTTPNSIDNQMLSERDQAIFDGFNAPSDAKDAADGALSLTVEAVVLASIAANGGNALETTGTLTQSGQNFTYSAGPNDRLVIAWTEGEPTEIYVSQLDGNFEAENIDAFFSDNHVVQTRVVRSGSVDVEVGSAKNGGAREGAITGSMTIDGVTYTLDLYESGNTEADIGTSGSYESNSTLTGTITAPNLSFVVQEEYTYKNVYVDNFVENRSRTANSRWTYNGAEYAVNGVFIRSAFLNAWPDEFDFWRAEGTITENGSVIGQVQFEENDVIIYVVLVLDSGEKIRLEEHLKYQNSNG